MVVDLFLVKELPPSEFKQMSIRELIYFHNLFMFGLECNKKEAARQKQLAAQAAKNKKLTGR